MQNGVVLVFVFGILFVEMADPFGFPTIKRPWDDESNSLDNAFRRARAAFEFMEKLGVKYYTFHDRDVAPEGKTIQETNDNLDKVVDLLKNYKIKLELNYYGQSKYVFFTYIYEWCSYKS